MACRDGHWRAKWLTANRCSRTRHSCTTYAESDRRTCSQARVASGCVCSSAVSRGISGAAAGTYVRGVGNDRLFGIGRPRRVKRCSYQGKVKLRDAGQAIRYVRRGESKGFYRCPHCGFFHLTKIGAPK